MLYCYFFPIFFHVASCRAHLPRFSISSDFPCFRILLFRIDFNFLEYLSRFFIIFADRYFNLLSYIHQLNCLHSFSLILCRLFLPSLLSLLPSYIFVFPSLVASFIFFHLFFLLLLNFISPFFFVFIHIILSSFLTLLLLKIF